MHVPRVTALFTVECDLSDAYAGLWHMGCLTQGGGEMFVPEHRLWSAVILNTVQEWLSGPLGLSQPAEQYLFHDEKDFPLLCECAGVNPGRLRSQLVSNAAA